MTPQERTELQRLAEQATPGPWSSAEVHGRFYVGNDGDNPHFIAHLYSHSAQEDAAYIAAANPGAILALLSQSRGRIKMDSAETPWIPNPDCIFEDCGSHAWVYFDAPDVPHRRDAIPCWSQPAGTHPVYKNIWHYDRSGDVLTLTPSVHVPGRYHSPNPALFHIVEESRRISSDQGVQEAPQP